MNSERLIKINLENARKVAQGIYSSLFCPKCEKKSAEAFFSEHNLKNGYGMWFECMSCGNVEHISCKSKPEGFTPLRLSDKFQKLDEDAWGRKMQGSRHDLFRNKSGDIFVKPKGGKGLDEQTGHYINVSKYL